MDKLACARQTFGTLYSHCGFCVKACPVGQDRRLFSGADIGSYHRAHADVARWSMGLFPMLAQGGEQVFGARNGRGSDAPARWPENGRHVGCQETAHITPSGEIPDKANRLGADLVLVLPLASMGNLGPGLTAPTRVWDRTQTLIVLGIRTLGEGSEGVEDLIINQIGYKFAVWLSQWAIASVYLARGPGVSGKFSADRLLSAGGISRPDLKRYRALAVLSELKCQRMYVKFFGDDKLRRNVFVYKGTKKVALTKLKIQEMLAKRYFKTYKYIYKKYNPIYWYKNTIEILKENLTLRACSLGAELVGFAQASATAAGEEAEADPATGAGVALPGWARAFVVLGVPLLLPVMETCPSVWGLEHEKTALIIGRKAVNRLASLLASLGCRAAALDSGGLALAKIAARAGLGSLGRNGRLLNEKYGPRVVVAALVTDVPVGTEEGLAGQGKSSGQLCQNCQNCLSVCPVGAERVGQASCLGYQKGLTADYKNPCGFCLRACPVGLDRQLYRSFDFKSYFDEAKALAAGKQPGGKQSWLRVRSYGSYPLSR
ncbi:MAG: hypothetical protein LBP92_08785 [Deltaproteobacteria bacterium]|nr:hypothetical protein [Deltaproteobacteria bacterium]